MMCEQNYNNSNLKIFMSFVLKHKKLFVIDMSFSYLIALIDILFPYLSRWSLRNMLQNNLFNAFFLVMFIFFVLYIIKAILHYLVTVIGHKMGTLIESDMREIIFTHIQTLSFSFFDKNRTGELLSRVTNDLFDIVELAHHGPENILICAITFIGTSIILMMINVYLTVVLILLLIISLCYCLYQRTVMKQTNKDVKVKIGKINSIIENGISGIRTTKAFANEDIENDKFNVVNEMFKSSKIWYYEAMGKFNGSIEATVGIMNVFVLSLGGYFIMKKSMDYIDLVTFTLYISIFITPIRKLTQVMEIYAQGMSGFERFLDVMRTKPDIVDSNNAFVLDNVKGLIKFENVSFKYDDSYILNNVNITINPGETVALVGESGGGKTTFCNLLLRFYDIQKGIISIDGIDIREVTQESLRKNIGIIQQDVFLYTDTILENIRYGNLQATDEEIINASKLAGIHNDILKMPMGYATFVGEKGIKLSGGQKQRISIARVFLKNPKILLLDEATSSLDSVTEQQIQESLNKLVFGKTTIIIAHRLSTIKNVNHIAVIGNNQILEYGTREELLNKNGIYKQFELAQQF